MLTPRRAGPEEIGDGADKGANGAASGSVTPGSYENTEGSKEFMSTGRTGRRNALPNILGRHAKTGLSDLSDRFGELSTHTGVDFRLLLLGELFCLPAFRFIFYLSNLHLTFIRLSL